MWRYTFCQGESKWRERIPRSIFSDFGQFQRLSNHNDYVSIMASELPDQYDQDYEFIRGKDPKWLADKLRHVLTDQSCRNSLALIPLLGAWLGSVGSCQESFIHLIPKKVPDKISSLEETTGYGMLAYSRPAIWRIFLTSLLYLGIGVAYMIMRWVQDWNDMQTALAPITFLFAVWLGHLHLALAVIDRYDITPPKT